MESSVEELIAAPVLVTFRADGESWTRLGPEPDRAIWDPMDLTCPLLKASTSPRLDGKTWTCGRWATVRLDPGSWTRLGSDSDLPALVFRPSVCSGAAEPSQIQSGQRGDEAAAGGPEVHPSPRPRPSSHLHLSLLSDHQRVFRQNPGQRPAGGQQVSPAVGQSEAGSEA